MLGADVVPPPTPAEIRDQFDALLEAQPAAAADGKSRHDVELLAALGIGR